MCFWSTDSCNIRSRLLHDMSSALWHWVQLQPSGILRKCICPRESWCIRVNNLEVPLIKQILLTCKLGLSLNLSSKRKKCGWLAKGEKRGLVLSHYKEDLEVVCFMWCSTLTVFGEGLGHLWNLGFFPLALHSFWNVSSLIVLTAHGKEVWRGWRICSQTI